MYSCYSKNVEVYICVVKVKVYNYFFILNFCSICYILIMRKICNVVFYKNKKKKFLDYKN